MGAAGVHHRRSARARVAVVAALRALSMVGTQKAMVTCSAAMVPSTGPGAKSRTMT